MACKQETLNLTITGDVICRAVKSFTFSKRYTKVMIRASILNILYRRMIMNESDLKTRKYEDIPFVVLKKKNVKDPLLSRYLSWIKGIGDAIDKNYLKEIFIFMENSANGELLENYRFNLKYNQEDNKENRHTPDELKQASLELLHLICELGKTEKLKDSIAVHVELTYFDETPKSYEPSGFEPSLGGFCQSIPKSANHMATLNTGFHKITCYGDGSAFTEINNITPAQSFIQDEKMEKRNQQKEIIATNDPENSELNEKRISVANLPITKNGNEISKPETAKTTKTLNELNISNITVSDNGNISAISGKTGSIMLTEEFFNCICQLTFPLDLEIVSCYKCKRQYHAPCHGYLNEITAEQTAFECICCDTNDQTLLQFNAAERPLLARVRIVLYFMEKEGKLPMNIIQLFPDKDKKTILEKLNTFNLFVKGKNSNKIDKAKLEQIILKFFIVDNSQILD